MLAPFLIIGCLLGADPASDASGLKTEVANLVQSLDADTAKERKDTRRTA